MHCTLLENIASNMTKASSMRTIDIIEKNLAKRYRAEKRFKLYGLAAIAFSIGCLLMLLGNITFNGAGAFSVTHVQLEVHFDKASLGFIDEPTADELAGANWDKLYKTALLQAFPDVKKRRDKKSLYRLLSNGAGFDLLDKVRADPALLGTRQTVWLLADDDIDTYYKTWLDGDAYSARVDQLKQGFIQQLHEQGNIALKFNTNFFTKGDSREPEQAGILGAAMGSLMTLLITMMLAFPIGVAAAVYLEEFAPANRLTDIIEVNINNLAAVPSIIFGLLGLAIFINFFGVPRSVPLVGGLVLSLMTLPTIIISSRAALKAVPPSIREAAIGLGASHQQAVFHHVLPLALPGMLTGTIIGLAQALGETAPLLMVGMIAFVADIPSGVTDPSTVLPVQIFLWADSPERAFTEKTSAAIMMLLGFLITMNLLAVYLRKRLERRW